MKTKTFLQELTEMISVERTLKGDTKRLQWLEEKEDEHYQYLRWCRQNNVEPLN